MTTYCAVKRRGSWRALAGIVFAGALALIVAAPAAHAQSLGSGTSVGSIPNDPELINLCVQHPSNACILVASFNRNLAPYWYISGGSSNGLGGAPIYFYINGVYQATYRANGATNPGAITVLGVLGTHYTFLGAQYYGSCTNNAYYQQGWTVTIPASSNIAYGLGIPYTC